MPAVYFPPTAAKVITTVGRGAKTIVKSRRNLSDLTDLALIAWNSKSTQDLVNSVYEEMRRRATNSAVEQARSDNELREEVIEELMAAGKARHVAENLTNTEAKLLAQARLVGII
jgi:hypothetical protein